MKIITLNIIIFAIQCAHGNTKPPEVIEIVQESYVPDATLTDLLNFPNTMLSYLSRYRRDSLHPKTTMDTYIEAYKLTHETYQNQQEADTTKVAEENDKILKRSKRAADPDPPHEKDFIKFELTDAIQPDDDTLKHRVFNKGRNFRMPYEIADTLVVFGNKTDGIDIAKPTGNVTGSDTKPMRRRRRKSRKETGNGKPKREINDESSEEEVDEEEEDDDMSIGESRKIKIIAPRTKNGELPIGVKKIIEMVMKDRAARAAKARSAKAQKSYGNKYNSNNGKDSPVHQKNVVRDTHHSNNNNEWRPVPQISLGRYPVVHGQMENAPDYLTFVPIKSYKTVSYGKPVQDVQQQQQQHQQQQQATPTIVPVTKLVPVPQIQYIIKEVPIPVHSGQESSQIKPSFKVTYDSSLLDSKLKESGFDTQTQAPSHATSESYVKIITPTTATKTHIDHSQKPAYKGPTVATTYGTFSNNNVFHEHLSSSPTQVPAFKKLPSYDNSPFKPSRPYAVPTLQPNYESHFESQKLDALTSLLNKDPNEQLKGFHELLQQEEQRQVDTAPILFHPNGIIPPKPLINLNIKVLDDPPKQQQQQKPEPISIEEFNRLYGHESVDLPGYSPPKAFTPIKEVPVVESHEPYKTSFKSITDSSKTPFSKHTKVQYKPVYNQQQPTTSEGKGPVIQHHDHKSHSTVQLSKGYEDDDEDKEHGYAFGYRVRDFYTGNDFGHTQNKNTDGKITGEYHILLPDKRVQIVRYYANDDGFHADVSYETPQTR